MHRALILLDKQSLSQPKVLLVEDCKFDTVFIKRIIEAYYPYTLIDHAILKSQACGFLEKNRYDVVFLDLSLPDSIGIEDVEQIKKLADGTPVIVVTGHYNKFIANRVKSYGVDGLIGKNDLVGNSFSAALQSAVNNLEKI